MIQHLGKLIGYRFTAQNTVQNVGLENTSVGQSGAGIEFGLGDIILVSLVHVTA